MLDRTGLAREFRKAQHARLVDAPGAHRKHGNRVFLRCFLENHGVQIVKMSRDLWQPAPGFAGLFNAAMNRGRALKIERFACSLAFALVFLSKRRARRREILNHTVYLHVVVFLRASREAWRETHFHL